MVNTLLAADHFAVEGEGVTKVVTVGGDGGGVGAFLFLLLLIGESRGSSCSRSDRNLNLFASLCGIALLCLFGGSGGGSGHAVAPRRDVRAAEVRKRSVEHVKGAAGLARGSADAGGQMKLMDELLLLFLGSLLGIVRSNISSIIIGTLLLLLLARREQRHRHGEVAPSPAALHIIAKVLSSRRSLRRKPCLLHGRILVSGESSSIGSSRSWGGRRSDGRCRLLHRLDIRDPAKAVEQGAVAMVPLLQRATQQTARTAVAAAEVVLKLIKFGIIIIAISGSLLLPLPLRILC